MKQSGRTGWIDALWLIVVGIISSAVIVTASGRLSGTFDERFYLDSGLTRWRTGSTFELMRAGTMPLPIDVTVFPLRIIEWHRGREWSLQTEYDNALRIARLGTLIFWWLLLVYVMRISNDLGGRWAGRLAVAAIAVEPNLLAHAGLATTDLALTATLLAFAYHYRVGRAGPWRSRVGLPAIWLALTMLSKASGMVFGPLCMIAIECERRWSDPAATSSRHRLATVVRGLLSRAYRWESVTIGTIALAFVYLYCGSDWQPHPKMIASAHQLPDGRFKDVAVWLAEHLRIFNNAGVGLMTQVRHNLQGHNTYLLGETFPKAIWYYFPVALVIKLPVAMLLAPVGAMFLARRHLFNWATIAALILLVFSLNCRVQIGIRMQLPLIALAICAVSVSAIRSLAEATAWRRSPLLIGIAAWILFTAFTTATTWPNHLAYANELWGGTENAHRYLSDSNVDWGQGLKELDEWRRTHDIDQIDIWYFGTDPAATLPPYRYRPLHIQELTDEDSVGTHLSNQYLAVSTTILYGGYVTEPAWLMDRLRATPTIGRTPTFHIFDMSKFRCTER